MESAANTLQRPSLWELLEEIPDQRRREGRIYPLRSVLGLLIVAGANGESSLRGMWLWGREHWLRLWALLGFKTGSRAPQYGTLWTILDGLDVTALESIFRRWSQAHTAAETEAISIDGKYLRGSKRSDQPALQVVSALGQELGQFIGQVIVTDGDSVAAAVDLLRGIPLQGKVVTMDAGLLQKPVAEVILAKGGPISGC